MADARDRVLAALDRIAFLLERAGEPTYRVRAFRTVARVVRDLPEAELVGRVDAGTLRELPGVGEVTAAVVAEAARGEVPGYLARLESPEHRPSDPRMAPPVSDAGRRLRQLLRGDLHVHSDWSDGGSPVDEMARAAVALGHDYMALTDHSPRLTVARGLSPERLREQLDLVARLNAELAPFRVLTGIEVDILEDGRLDQEPELLAELDVVVASVHSVLRMPAEPMTARMVAAVADPNVDVLGHCTGRLVTGRGRPPSTFEAEVVFEACRRFGVAVEVNSRPERLDPPTELLRLAVDAGCLLSVDSDAHAPGQLDWQVFGCTRVAATGVAPARVVTTWEVDRLLTWTREHGRGTVHSSFNK